MDEPRRPSRIHLTFYTFVQEEEIWENTVTMEIRSWNQSNRRCTQEIKCKILCNDNQERKIFEPIAEQTVKSRFNCGVQVKIYGTMLLHPKEG